MRLTRGPVAGHALASLGSLAETAGAAAATAVVLVARRAESREHSLAALELLGEELVQLVVHLQQINCCRLGDHQLQLVPAQVSVHEYHSWPDHNNQVQCNPLIQHHSEKTKCF